MLQALPPPDPPAALIVVTGQALPDPAAERAYSVDVLTEEDLAKAPSDRLDQALKQAAGIQLFRRSDSSSGHPTSQGVTLRALGGNASSRALLILDGVPQADPFGGWINWPAYDPESLGKARIIRGGAGVVYGPGALAGVINLNSKASPAIDIGAAAGSRSSLMGRGHFGIEAGAGLLTVNLKAARSDGFILQAKESRGAADRRAPYEQSSLRVRYLVPINDHVELQASSLAFIDQRTRGLAFTDNRTRGADASLRLVGSGSWPWSATVYGQWRNFRSSFATVDDARATAQRVALQDSVPSVGKGVAFELRPPIGKAAELIIGADARVTDGESREFYSYQMGEPTRRREAGGHSATAGMFADIVWTRGKATFNGGARLDRWLITDGKLHERTLATGSVLRDDRFADRNGWQPSARAAAMLDLGGGFSARSAAYLGWRMPTLNELFRPFRAGPDATAANALLDPERLSGAEIGLLYRRPSINLSLVAFANRLADSIANVTLGQGPGIFPGVGFVAGTYRQRQNLEAVISRGLEASADFKKGNWSLDLGISVSNAKVQARGASSSLDGLRPAQTPALMLSSKLAWEKGGRAASITLNHNGAQYEDDLNRRRLPPATTVDAYLAWPLGDRLQLVARGENLFNEQVVAGVGDDGSVERATPRTLWIALKASLL